MTTIACDGKTVAADGLSCCGDERIETDTKKLIVDGQHIYGITGDYPIFDAAVKWYLEGAKPGEQPKASSEKNGGGWSFLVFKPDHVVSFTDDMPYADTFPYPAAFGSGNDYAMGAMYAGKSSQEAVQIAAKLTITTGGIISVFNLPQANQDAA